MTLNARPMPRILAEFVSDDASMAVEFALVAPILIVFVMLTISFGMAYNIQLRLETAAGAAIAYAQKNAVTHASFGTFATGVTKVAQAAANFDSALTVEVDVNNTSDGSAADTPYCVDGTPPVWRAMSDASASCGNNVTAGQFVTVKLSTTANSFLPTAGVVGSVIPLSETITARMPQ
ncbi:MAG: pilus assembly protein [Alphaproteobacteria bacterium]|nr:pilus assembly protein [Alphaproteobacteria bacterium]